MVGKLGVAIGVEFMMCLDTAYYAEIEKLLLKVLQINVKIS